MSVNPSNLIPIRNAIQAQLISEMVSGRISGVESIGSSWLNDVSLYPYIFVWPMGGSEQIFAVRRKKETVDIQIGLAYKSVLPYPTIEDAYNNLYTLMDDGNGNGLMAILRDPNNYTWGGLASYSEIVDYKFYDTVDSNKASSMTNFAAYCVMHYRTTQVMYWDGVIK
jgi:hypothetical protein